MTRLRRVDNGATSHWPHLNRTPLEPGIPPKPTSNTTNTRVYGQSSSPEEWSGGAGSPGFAALSRRVLPTNVNCHAGATCDAWGTADAKASE